MFLRRVLNLTLVLTALGLAPGCKESSAEVVRAAIPDPEDRPRTAERLVAILDYVASDYGGAVQDGAVVSPAEYEEQIGMVASARKLASELPRVPMAEIDALDAAVRAKEPAAEVARRCARIRGRAVEGYSIVTAPALPPSLARGREIFKQNCIQCHGLEGRGDGKEGIGLDPRPANLHDPERMAAVTPYRAYCDVTYGIEGTGMPALLLPAADRWSVAFYACAVRHVGSREGAGGGRVGLATLANATDEELAKIANPESVAYLRAVAPFVASGSPIAYARKKLAEAEEAALGGARAEADRLVLDAYLGGVEEVEAPLRARDGALVARLEDATAALRAEISKGGDAAAVRARTADLLALLDRAERTTDEKPAGAGLLALAAAIIVLREGLEAALIVAAILAVVRRVGLPRSAGRAVHGGWIAALAAGLATFALARTVLSRLLVNRELIEGAVALLAAAVLFATSFWLISKADARRWLAYVKERAAGSAALAAGVPDPRPLSRPLLGLFALAFLAAYREAFESVLFFEALLSGEAARALPLAAGALAGALLLGLAVLALGRAERRLPIGPFFAASGGLLSALAVVLLGHGLHALEASAFVLPRPVEFIRVEWLGIYPDAISLRAQAALLGVIVLGSIAMRLRAPEASRP